MSAEARSSKRPVRSFVIRSGRLTDSQRKAIDEHWDRFIVPFETNVIDWSALFSDEQPLTVEIGFGMGDSLLQMAKEQPNCNFIGIEVHRAGVGKLLSGIDRLGLSNLKIVCHDAVEVFKHCFEANSIERVLVFFPDPWHKRRHNKRRIIQPEFVSLLADRLQVNGRLHLATDWRPYAEHMLEVLNGETMLKNAVSDSDYWRSPERPPTKFEQRGKRLGHGVWDLFYLKQ